MRNVSRNFCSFEFSVKEISFPSLESDLFVTFDYVELTSFLIDSEKYLIPVFLLCASFRNFYLFERYLRKVVLRAETCFAIIELYRKKITKLFFCDSCLRKSGFRVSGLTLGVIFWHWENDKSLKLGPLKVKDTCKRSRFVILMNIVSRDVSKIGKVSTTLGTKFEELF